jgi:two-component system, LytTR family, sensor kinase
MRFLNTLIYSNQPGIRIFRHVLFWTVDMLNWLMVISINSKASLKDVYFFLLSAPLSIAATYFIMYYLLPKFSGKDEKGKLFLWGLAVLLLLGVSHRILKYFVLVPLLDLKPILANEVLLPGSIVLEIFKWLAVISMAIAIKVIKSKTELQDKNDQLVNEKKIAELNFLKLQMHPHFLFNTLNTLYSKTIQNSEQAGQVVMHLSHLLRFMLEECNKPQITLEKEIKVITDYIALEKLRHGARLNVDISVPKNLNGHSLSPLLFLPFIENSIKHSLNNIRGQVHIGIQINLTDTALHLIVENDQVPAEKVNGKVAGKGIANIKRQLELLYDKEHSLIIDDHGDKFRVSLQIPVKSAANV